MIDIHLHILPGIDDGPQTLQGSLALARVLVQEGVKAAIATPHFNDEFARRSASEICWRVKELQRELNYHNIPLRLFAGHEASIRPGLINDIQTGSLATLNGSRYLLLEFWNTPWLLETEQLIFELRAQGIIPILAHPERHRIIQKNPDRLAALQRQGVLTQLTLNSLVGMHGTTARHCAELLLKKGFVHFMASDAHGLHRSLPAITYGMKRAIELVGQERVHQLVEVWPTAVVKNAVCCMESS